MSLRDAAAWAARAVPEAARKTGKANQGSAHSGPTKGAHGRGAPACAGGFVRLDRGATAPRAKAGAVSVDRLVQQDALQRPAAHLQPDAELDRPTQRPAWSPIFNPATPEAEQPAGLFHLEAPRRADAAEPQAEEGPPDSGVK